MPLVEQAVFSSAETDRSSGYHLLGRSKGVGKLDAKELRVWCPAHDSLLELGPDAVSYNFHPLPSGAFCVSRSISAGFEYSGRGGPRVYTQCLILAPEVLRQFSNNPFAVIRAAVAGGLMKPLDRVPEELPSLQLSGRTGAVDHNALSTVAASPGPRPMALMLQNALDSTCLAFAGAEMPDRVVAGLFNCLPVECRTQFSFCTGLKYSSRRPFRILALSDDRSERHWVRNNGRVTVLDLAGEEQTGPPSLDGWACYVEQVLLTGRTALLAKQLSKPHPDLTEEDLPALGLQLLEEFETSTFQDSDAEEADDEGTSTQPANATPPAASCCAEELQQAHAAHKVFKKTVEESSAAQVKATAPSTTMTADSPEVMQQLEHLDDVVFDAISGKPNALAELKTLWPEVCTALGEELLAESREQYLRYALTIWEESTCGEVVRNPSRAAMALEVLCILFDDV